MNDQNPRRGWDGVPPAAELVLAPPEPGLLAVLRTRLFEVYVIVFSLLIGLAICTYFQFRRRPKEVRWILRLWSTLFVDGAWRIMGVRHRVEGLENVPDEPVLFVCSHQSYWESIAMTAFVPDINVISKRGAMKYPIFGWGLLHAPMIAVDRDKPGRNLLRIVRESRRSLAEGRSVLIFPEGTRVPPGGRRPFERGVEALYAACDVPVIPVVNDAGMVWPSGFRAKAPGLITLRFLPPFRRDLPPDEFLEALERRMNDEKDRLLQERFQADDLRGA